MLDRILNTLATFGISGFSYPQCFKCLRLKKEVLLLSFLRYVYGTLLNGLLTITISKNTNK